MQQREGTLAENPLQAFVSCTAQEPPAEPQMRSRPGRVSPLQPNEAGAKAFGFKQGGTMGFFISPLKEFRGEIFFPRERKEEE